MKYGIRLISKHTGDSVAVLGYQFDTKEEAKEYFENEVCTSDNRMENVYIHDGYVWKNKDEGFVPRRVNENRRRDNQICNRSE